MWATSGRSILSKDRDHGLRRIGEARGARCCLRTAVIFASGRNGVDDLFRTRADGAGDEQLLVKSGISSGVRKYPTDWSGHWIVFTAFDSRRKQDLWVVDAQRSVRPYLQTEFSERDGHLSPDERWMLYTSDEAGADAV